MDMDTIVLEIEKLVEQRFQDALQDIKQSVNQELEHIGDINTVPISYIDSFFGGIKNPSSIGFNTGRGGLTVTRTESIVATSSTPSITTSSRVSLQSRESRIGSELASLLRRHQRNQ